MIYRSFKTASRHKVSWAGCSICWYCPRNEIYKGIASV